LAVVKISRSSSPQSILAEFEEQSNRRLLSKVQQIADQLHTTTTPVARRQRMAKAAPKILPTLGHTVIVAALVWSILFVLLVQAIPWIDLFAPANKHNFLGHVFWFSRTPGEIAIRYCGTVIAVSVVLLFAVVFAPRLWERRYVLKYPLVVVAASIVQIVVAFAAMYAQAAHDHPTGIKMCFTHQPVTVLDAIYFSLGTMSTATPAGLELNSQQCRGFAVQQIALCAPVILLGVAAIGPRLQSLLTRRAAEAAAYMDIDAREQAILKVLDRRGDEMTVTDVAEATGFQRSRAKSILDDLVEDRLVVKTGRRFRARRDPKKVAEAAKRLEQTNPRQAAQTYWEGLESNPNNEMLLTAYAGFLAYVEKDLDGAQELYDLVIAAYPRSVVIFQYAFFLTYMRKDYDRAQELYDRAIDVQPRALVFYEYALLLAYVRKDYDRAKELFDRAVADDPRDSMILAGYARFLAYARKDYPGALRAALRAQWSRGRTHALSMRPLRDRQRRDAGELGN
jgi:tetratricopeptide (TPR) repeat protein